MSKLIINRTLLLVVMALVFSSCERENMEETVISETTTGSSEVPDKFVSGTVSDENGNLLNDAEISLYKLENLITTTITDDNGEFLIEWENIDSSQLFLVVNKENHHGSIVSYTGGPQHVQLSYNTTCLADYTATVDDWSVGEGFEGFENVLVEGVVESLDGRPLQFITVETMIRTNEFLARSITSTDVNGRWRKMFPKGYDFELKYYGRGHTCDSDPIKISKLQENTILEKHQIDLNLRPLLAKFNFLKCDGTGRIESGNFSWNGPGSFGGSLFGRESTICLNTCTNNGDVHYGYAYDYDSNTYEHFKTTISDEDIDVNVTVCKEDLTAGDIVFMNESWPIEKGALVAQFGNELISLNCKIGEWNLTMLHMPKPLVGQVYYDSFLFISGTNPANNQHETLYKSTASENSLTYEVVDIEGDFVTLRINGTLISNSNPNESHSISAEIKTRLFLWD